MAAPVLAIVGTAAYLLGSGGASRTRPDAEPGQAPAPEAEAGGPTDAQPERDPADAREAADAAAGAGAAAASEEVVEGALVGDPAKPEQALARSATPEAQPPPAPAPSGNPGLPPVAPSQPAPSPPVAKRRRKLRPVLTEAEVHALLEEFDVNRDGRIDADELRDLASAVGLALDDQDVEDCIRALDTDGDGSIDEFELARWLVQQDEDGAKRTSNAPYELRARLIARSCGRALTRQANLATAQLLLGDEADEALAEAAILRAKAHNSGDGAAGGGLKSPEESERIRACLDQVSLLDPLSRAKKERLVRAFRSRHFQAGEQIITQGKVGDAFYILQRGACRVVKEEFAAGDGATLKELRVLHAGAHFGELALKNNTVRSATVEAVQPSLVLELKAGDFKAIIGPLLHVIHFTEWATAGKVVSDSRDSRGGASGGNATYSSSSSSSSSSSETKRAPPKLGPRAATGEVFSSGSHLEVFRNRKVVEYEARLRRLSSPGKVFAYYASVETEEGEQMMTGTDFLKALGVLHTHVVAGQQGEVDEAAKRFTARIMSGAQENDKGNGDGNAGAASTTDGTGKGEGKGRGGGLISFAEYVFFRSLLSIKPSDLEMAFQIFDRNEDGLIGRDEFIHMFSTLSRGGGPSSSSSSSSSSSTGSADSTTMAAMAADVLDGSPVFSQWFGNRAAAGGGGGGGISFAKFSAWLTALQSELIRLEFLNWATDSSGDGKVDSLSASDFGRMVVQLVASAGFDVKEHRRRRAEMSDDLAMARVSLADFARFSLMLAQLELVEAALDLVATSSSAGGSSSSSSSSSAIDRATFERGIYAALGPDAALPPTIIDVLFTVLDGDSDGKLSRDELCGTLRERRRALGGAALERPSAYSCFAACFSKF